MAPTTLLGQVTTSSPTGRESGVAGYPIPIIEMLAVVPGTAYAARGSIATPQLIGRTKQMLKKSFEAQIKGAGFSIVEVLSTCPVGWGLTAEESMKHVETEVVKTYPLGVYADHVAERRAAQSPGETAQASEEEASEEKASEEKSA
jgi:2-oxoglutarate/2-oxoacid ferredoxin oxidoreductase subunit beta